MSKCYIKSGSDRTPVFERYPLPWERGLEHETICVIIDRDGREVIELRGGLAGTGDPFLSDIADAILGLVNASAVGHSRRGPLAVMECAT